MQLASIWLRRDRILLSRGRMPLDIGRRRGGGSLHHWLGGMDAPDSRVTTFLENLELSGILVIVSEM